jgi:hypothetical protein
MYLNMRYSSDGALTGAADAREFEFFDGKRSDNLNTQAFLKSVRNPHDICMEVSAFKGHVYLATAFERQQTIPRSSWADGTRACDTCVLSAHISTP